MPLTRPVTTLFMLTSVDGKISMGDSDELDFDRDLPNISWVSEGLQQYYDLEQQTDLYSLNSGRVLEKIGVNEKIDEPQKTEISFIIIDSKPHLNANWVAYLAKKSKTLFIATNNLQHPAYTLKPQFWNIEIIPHIQGDQLGKILEILKTDYAIERITVQSGGTLNAGWLRSGLIDHISLVIAPILIGGKNTSTLIDGESLHGSHELSQVRTLVLRKCTTLDHSYLHLQYDVVN